MVQRKDRIQLLVDIILDPNAKDHEKDDAAMDLAEYDDDRALQALIQVSQNPTKEDQSALDVYGETIGIYWVKRNFFPLKIYLSLKGTVRSGICNVLETKKPEWVEKYELYIYGFNNESEVRLT